MRLNNNLGLGLFASLVSVMSIWPASAQQTKPNILVIMADDIGYWNISAYNRGMMGYRTPNIDRIANEGALFTDYYGQQSCTAGRSAFITGQSPMRTGLLKVGLPGAKEGLSDKDPTLADLLKPLGYVSGQFGKNHLGDRNEFLPTVARSTKSAGPAEGLPDTKVGTFTQELFDEGKRDGWIVISMKDDWKTIFPLAKTNP
jgi:arylsulfatase A-like enzyme